LVQSVSFKTELPDSAKKLKLLAYAYDDVGAIVWHGEGRMELKINDNSIRLEENEFWDWLEDSSV
jgi:hypothetical protein